MNSNRFESLSPAQTAVLGQVATGNGAGCPRILEALAAKGYLSCYFDERGGPFPVKVRRYRVPVDVHLRWAGWCAALSEERYAEVGENL